MKFWSDMTAAELADVAHEIADDPVARTNLSNPYVLIEHLARRVAELEACLKSADGPADQSGEKM